MKRIYSIIILPLLVACSHTPADHFVLRGIVPGAMDSTEVDLRVDGRVIEPIEGYIIDGKFELKGQLPAGAVYARLSMNNNDIASRKGIREENAVKYVEANIFIENGNLTFSTPHIDSLPQSFWRYDIRRENNYTLKGSAAHDVFDRYRRATLDLQYRLRREERAAWEEKREPDAKAIAAMRSELRQAHPRIYRRQPPFKCQPTFSRNVRNGTVHLYPGRPRRRDSTFCRLYRHIAGPPEIPRRLPCRFGLHTRQTVCRRRSIQSPGRYPPSGNYPGTLHPDRLLGIMVRSLPCQLPAFAQGLRSQPGKNRVHQCLSR